MTDIMTLTLRKNNSAVQPRIHIKKKGGKNEDQKLSAA